MVDPDAVRAMMQAAKQQLGGIDFLLNNAAILRDRTLAKMSLDDWQAVVDVNLTGVFHCCKFGLEVMRDGGAIVSGPKWCAPTRARHSDQSIGGNSLTAMSASASVARGIEGARRVGSGVRNRIICRHFI